MKTGFKITGLFVGITIGVFALCLKPINNKQYFMDWYWFNFELKPAIEAEHKLKER